MDLNYYDTLIAVAEDCPVSEAVVPKERGGKKTIAGIQYEMLADNPYTYTQEDVLFNSWFQRQGLPELSEDELTQLREEFFSKPRACLRTSPLAKKHGWGLLFDDQGRIALCPMESDEYRETLENGKLKILKAMRSKRK